MVGHIKIQREMNATRLNEILNHPSVRPFVAEGDDPIDMGKDVANERNYVLVGEHGAVFFVYIFDGLYEAHTQILPEGRGEWAKQLVSACAEYMFTRTPALEIMTRVPEGHMSAKTLTGFSGMRFEFTRYNELKYRGKIINVDIYSGRLQDWLPAAPYMIDKGRQFHTKLNKEAERLGVKEAPHDDDENHNQYLGACISMAQGGELLKAVTYYNRWAVASRHAVVDIFSYDPPIIKFDIGHLKIKGPEIEDIEVELCAA